MSLSQQDIFIAMRALLLAISDKYAPATIDTPGQDVNLFLNLVAAGGEELSREASLQDLGHYLATVASAGDEAVERLVSDLTGAKIQRFRENAAVVDLAFNRSNSFAISLPPGTVATTDKDGLPYRTVDEAAWATDDTGEKVVRAVCEVTGPDGNVNANTITKISVGDDPTITVNNPTAASGGRVLETIPELLSRARDWFVNAPRGTLSAIEFGAKQTVGVVSATGTELTRPLAIFNNEIPIFRVRLAIGDVSGQAGNALVEDTRRTLQEYRGAGIPVVLVGSLVNEVKVVWTGLAAKPNYTLATLQSELTAKIVAFSGTLGPDIPIERADLFALAKSVEGFAGIPAGSLTAPADDADPPPGYTNRIRAKDVTYQ